MVTLPRTPEFTLKNNNRSKSKGNQDTYQELDATTNQPTNIAASYDRPIANSSVPEGGPVSGFIGAPLWL